MAAFYFGPAASAELIFYSPFMAGRVQQATTKRRVGCHHVIQGYGHYTHELSLLLIIPTGCFVIDLVECFIRD